MSAAQLRFIEATAGSEPRGALIDLCEGALDGVIVRGALPQEAMAAAAARAESRTDGPTLSFSKESPVNIYGALLHEADASQAGYLDAVAPARELLRSVFAPVDVDAELMALLGRLAGSRKVRNAQSATGRPYGTGTLRCIEVGGFLPVHVENLELSRPGYAGIRDEIASTLLSMYLMVQPADEGGELAIHPVRVDASKRYEMSGGGLAGESARELQALLETTSPDSPPLRAGDVIVFNAGQWFHEVGRVGGHRRRWTYGGFLALSARDGAFMVWS